MSSYDDIPYQSLPVCYTHLPTLSALARLHGHPGPAPEKCRVLEIGCAEGGNIIPMAWYWPVSEFVGIDLSSVQIAAARDHVRNLGLDNIELHAADFATLASDQPEPFDYILVHGVYSWIPLQQQPQLLSLIKQLLKENGLAYVSYNTYPGWHAQMVIRDAIDLYCGATGSAAQRLARLRPALGKLKSFFTAADNAFTGWHLHRLDALEKHSDAYLFHEFLEAENHPVYFRDFIASASTHGLQYVTDAYLPVDQSLLLGKARREFLSDEQDERISRLQKMDFMINQRFRRSILCHSSHTLRDAFGAEHMTGLAFRCRLQCREKPSLNRIKNTRYYRHDADTYLVVTHPVTKAAIQLLSEIHPSSLHFKHLLQQACQRVADHGGLQHINNIEPFYQELFLLVIDDMISLDTAERQYPALNDLQKFRISPLASHYAQCEGYMPSPLQKAIDMDALGKRAIVFMQNATDRDSLVDYLLKTAAHPSYDSLPGVFGRRGKISKQLEIFLRTLQRNGLLESIE